MVRKTHRRKSHRRQTHRHRTVKRGGSYCGKLRGKFDRIKERVSSMTINTYEGIHNDIRNLHDLAERKGCSRLAEDIDNFENTVLSNMTRKLF